MWKVPCSSKSEYSFYFLGCPKILFLVIKLLLQIPKGRDVEDDDTFVFDDQFTAPLYRIKVVHIFFS